MRWRGEGVPRSISAEPFPLYAAPFLRQIPFTTTSTTTGTAAKGNACGIQAQKINIKAAKIAVPVK